MPFYTNCSFLDPDQGMTQADIAAIKRVSTARNEIIMFRNTGCWSRPYIALGHPTKPFHVKGKSSDWGPQAGLVPKDSEFSKAVAQKDILKGVQLNLDAIKQGYARTMRLFITEQFLADELLPQKGSDARAAIERVTRPRDNMLYFYCIKPGEGRNQPGKDYILFGKKQDSGLIEVFTFPLDAPRTHARALFLKESMGLPMIVMTVPNADKPLTGDYDLFAVCPSWGSFGAKDMKMDPTLDDPFIKASNARTTNITSLETLARINSGNKEDPHMGNITPRIRELVAALKSGMGGRYPRVHHNAESGRPFAPGAEDGFPLTVFHPKPGIGGYHFTDAVIKDLPDLRDYFQRIYKDGYFPPRNHSWNMRGLHLQGWENSAAAQRFAAT